MKHKLLSVCRWIADLAVSRWIAAAGGAVVLIIWFIVFCVKYAIFIGWQELKILWHHRRPIPLKNHMLCGFLTLLLSAVTLWIRTAGNSRLSFGEVVPPSGWIINYLTQLPISSNHDTGHWREWLLVVLNLLIALNGSFPSLLVVGSGFPAPFSVPWLCARQNR